MRCLLLVALALPLLTAPDGESKEAALADLRGRWACVDWIRDGQVRNLNPDAQFVIEESKMVTTTKGRTNSSLTIELDLAKSPRWFDLIAPDGTRIPGIYRLEGDTFTLCHASAPDRPRPTGFESVAGRNENLRVFRRISR